MQRLFNMDKWFLVEVGKSISFGNREPRRIRLDVNAPSFAQLYYSDGDGRVTFLATVRGRDVVEFAAYGEFSITVSGCDCWMYTIDGEDLSFSIPDAVIFTRIVERRARNPELEMMQHMMNRNLELRMAAQRDELEQLWNRRDAAAKAAPVVAPAAKPDAAPGKEPKPSGVSGGGGDDKPPVGSGGTAPKD